MVEAGLGAETRTLRTAGTSQHQPFAGKTATELIAARADALQTNMGLTNWKGAAVRKADVTGAKTNYTKRKLAN